MAHRTQASLFSKFFKRKAATPPTEGNKTEGTSIMTRAPKVNFFDHDKFVAWLNSHSATELMEALGDDGDYDFANMTDQDVIQFWRAFSGQKAGRVSKDAIDWTRSELEAEFVDNQDGSDDEGEQEENPVDDEGELTEEAANEGEQEEGSGKGSVVAAKYRKRYAEAGHADNCGDWLANVLAEETHGTEGFDLEAYTHLLDSNGVDYSKYQNRSRGWQGRFRMTTRAILTKAVAASGYLIVRGNKKVKAPAEWVELNKPKPKKTKKAKPAPVVEAPVKAERKPRARKAA